MTLQARKDNIIREFLKVKDVETISIFEKILKDRQIQNYENNLKPMSIEQLRSEIEQSVNEIRDGQFTTSDELEKEIDKW